MNTFSIFNRSLLNRIFLFLLVGATGLIALCANTFAFHDPIKFPTYSVENLKFNVQDFNDENLYLNQKASLYLHRKAELSFQLNYYKDASSFSVIFNQENIAIKYFILTNNQGFDVSLLRKGTDEDHFDLNNDFDWKSMDLRWNGVSKNGRLLRNNFSTYLNLETSFVESPFLSSRNLIVIYMESLNGSQPLMFAAPINMDKTVGSTVELVPNAEEVLKILEHKQAVRKADYYKTSIFDFVKKYKNFWKKLGHSVYEMSNSQFNSYNLGIQASEFDIYTDASKMPSYEVYQKMCGLFYPYGKEKTVCQRHATSVIDISRFDIIYNIPASKGKKYPMITPYTMSGTIELVQGKKAEKNESQIKLTSKYASLNIGVAGEFALGASSTPAVLSGAFSVSGGAGVSFNDLTNDMNWSTTYTAASLENRTSIDYLEITAPFQADVVSCFAIRSLNYVEPGSKVYNRGYVPSGSLESDTYLNKKEVNIFCLPKVNGKNLTEKYYYIKESRGQSEKKIVGESFNNMGTFVTLRGLGNFQKFIDVAQAKTVKWSTHVTYASYFKELTDVLGLGTNEYYKFQFYPGVIKSF